MTKYGKFEKLVINKLINGVNNMIELCSDILVHAKININFGEKEAGLFLSDSGYDDILIKKEVDEISSKIITIIKLINDLNNEGYIILYKSSINLGDPFTFGPEIGACREHKFADRHIINLLLDCIDKRIIITQSLHDYVNHNYRNDEEIRHRRTMNVAWSAIIFSFMVGIAGIGIIIYSLSRASKIDQSQFEIYKRISTETNQQYKSISDALNEIVVNIKKDNTHNNRNQKLSK